MRTRIMYVECKAGGLRGGRATIGRVSLSNTGRTIRYGDREFRSLKGSGFKANYVDVLTGEQFWISGPKKDGSDRLYGEHVPVEIDEGVRLEYWSLIRGQPERSHETVANR